MLEIVKMLQELSDKIGNGASVRIEFRRYENKYPEIVFRVDWPDDFHVQNSFSMFRISDRPNDILEMMVYAAQHAYADKEKAL